MSLHDHHDETHGVTECGSASTSPPIVGYRQPPLHTRFKPGVSGNPSGRAKGSQNLKTLFDKILKEEVSLREGSEVRKVSKAEAILRGLVIGAMKGEPRNLAALLRLAEQTGHFDVRPEPITAITRIILEAPSQATGSSPACRDLSREDR